MARLTFPDEGSRLVFRMSTTSTALLGAAGGVATVYSNSAGTTLADIQTPEGVGISSSELVVDQFSRLPLFLGPDGVDTVFVSVDGGPVSPVYARADDRIDGKLDSATGVAYNSARLGGVSAPLYLLTSDANAAYVAKANMAHTRAEVANIESTSNTGYSDLATVGPVADFVAPASGQVTVLHACHLKMPTAGEAALATVLVRRVSDLAVVFAAADINAVAQVGGSAAFGAKGSFVEVPGLTPGVQYRAQQAYRSTISTSVASFANRKIAVIPSA